MSPDEMWGPTPLGGRIALRLRRDVPLAALDLTLATITYLAPFVLRFDGHVPDRYWQDFWTLVPVFATIHVLVHLAFGLYGQMWRYASVLEARRAFLSGIVAGGVNVAIAGVLSGRGPTIPMSVVLLGASMALMASGAVRFQSRLFALRRRTAMDNSERALLVGAGEAGSLVLKDLLRNPSLGLHPVAFIDDDPRKQGLSLNGVPIVGNRAALPSTVARLGITQVLLTVPSAASEVVRDIAALCEEAVVHLKILPSVKEAVRGKVTARDIRDLRIEDLLGRQQVQTDMQAIAGTLRDRVVLVTGAGGSIGSEIARQVAALGPAKLLVLDHDETHLHDLMTELGSPVVEAVLADIRQRERIVSTFFDHRPDVVFHAAAHKHVPILERFPEEAVLTNILGTANVADSAAAAGTKRFVMISTDKAIRPSSVMGGSKWFAEQVVRSLHGNGCTFCSVRFGNVLGSRGSVIPTFLKQIERGGPVTVTDPAMTRYFMSVQEAVQLVLQAGALASGGEVFTLDMGEPMSVHDLARKLIRLAGKVPGKDIEITIVGRRPGEKLAEDLIDLSEEGVPSQHPSIFVSRPPIPDRRSLRTAIRELETFSEMGKRHEIAAYIKSLSATSFGMQITEASL